MKNLSLTARSRIQLAAACLAVLGAIVAVIAIAVSEESQQFGGLALFAAATSLGAGIVTLSMVIDSYRSRSVKQPPESLEAEREEFEQWRTAELEAIAARQSSLDERDRELANRFARYREFLEYPVDDEQVTLESNPSPWTDKDRRVREILERESEVVYEKIRSNGYTNQGAVDLDAIGRDLVDLITRVAQVYVPESKNPIMETSFEQLARSASRICLHSLVMLERMPLDVKTYNISQMHGYLRTAVQTYGAYQQVSPWLKHLSGGLYAGRMASGFNPVTLGAWWVASEVGRRGAGKLIQNVVDRQAITLLNDFITIIGIEVANIYGPGIRQRDAAWVYGAELTELVTRFPCSDNSVAEALREISALPLQSEYDRVFLYRCVATRRSAGFRIQEPTMIPRTQRDEIAKRLEAFFQKFFPDAGVKAFTAWRDDVEARLDLRLCVEQDTQAIDESQDIRSAVASIFDFLATVACISRDEAAQLIADSELLKMLPDEQRAGCLEVLTGRQKRFEPPQLDPLSPITETYLKSLAATFIASTAHSPEVEMLLIETACYFRRSPEEAASLYESLARDHVHRYSADGLKTNHLTGDQLRVLARHCGPAECLLATFTGCAMRHGQQQTDLPDAVLIVHRLKDARRRAMLVSTDSEREQPLWIGDNNWHTIRQSGLVIDSCQIVGGQWSDDLEQSPDSLIVPGQMLGRGYERTFAALVDDNESGET